MSVGEEIWKDIQDIVNKSTNTFRVRMDANVHCMDVGIQALKASDPSIDYATKEKLHRLFRKNFLFTFDSLEEGILHSKDSDNIDRTCFVEDRQLGDYIVGPSYSTLQRRVASILKTSDIGSVFTGTDENGKTTTNIGHLSLEESSAATTPLEAKLKRLLDVVESTPIASALVSSKINQLHKYHNIGTSYRFNRKNFDFKNLENILGSGVVLVTLQTSIKNNQLAILEKSIDQELRSYFKNEKFHKKLLKLHGSNTIPEDIAGAFKAILRGDTTVVGSKHAAKAPKTTSSSLLNKASTSISKPSAIKSTTPTTVNLVNLQNFINKHLQSVISANMGDGRRKDILNYRTGRFAASAKVERMSQSRQGMITAFYSYMQNPYGTFSKGGKQSIPPSRDPKLLIAKSIREIAAEKVSNRMRSVLS
jgi:hypothetical protein